MTTCPSGVDYMHLVDSARAHIEEKVPRRIVERTIRSLLAAVLPHPSRFRMALKAASIAQPFVPLYIRELGVTVPIEMPASPNLNEAVRGKFGNPRLRVVPRAKKTDSSEVYLDDEYIAVLFRDDASGRTWTFEMAVLDFDLDPDAQI